MKHIVKHEHDCRAEQSVYDADKDEAEDGWISWEMHYFLPPFLKYLPSSLARLVKDNFSSL